MCINKSFSKNAKNPAGLISSTFTFYIVRFRLDPTKIWSPRLLEETFLKETKQTLTHFEGVAQLQNFSSQENHPKGSCSQAQPPAATLNKYHRVAARATGIICSKLLQNGQS